MAYVVHTCAYVVLRNYHLFISFYYIIALNGASLVCSIAASETLFAGIACAIILAGAPIFQKLCHSLCLFPRTTCRLWRTQKGMAVGLSGVRA